MTTVETRLLPRGTGQEPGGRLRLLCLPYAGGGASIFHEWSTLLSDVEVVPVQLPGRERRFQEPAHDNMAALVAELACVSDSVLTQPYALFGHSMGALVAFELVRTLRGQSRPLPRVLLVSASRAPHRRSQREPAADTMELLRRLKDLGGTSREAWASPELLSLMLPTLRSDFRLVDTYAYQHESPLPCPIVALHGEDDPEATTDETAHWSAQTTSAFRHRTLPGGHFNIVEDQQALVRGVAEALVELGV